MVEPTSVPSPLGGGGADGPTWRTDDDPGTASTRAVDHRDRAADGARPQDRPQIYRARHRGAGLRAALGRAAQQARSVHGISARAGDRLSRSECRAADPRDPRARLCRRLYRGEALPRRDPTGRTGRSPTRCASRPRRASRPRSTLRASSWTSPTIPAPAGSSGCSAWCSATRASCSRATSCTRIYRRCCAVISRRSRRSAACRSRSSTTA